MNNLFLYILLFITGIFTGLGLFILFKKKIFAGEYQKIDLLKKELKEKNKDEFDSYKKKMSIELKEEFSNWKNEYNRKNSTRASKLSEMEKRLIQREENLDRRC